MCSCRSDFEDKFFWFGLTGPYILPKLRTLANEGPPFVKNLDISTSYLLPPFYPPKMPRDLRENEAKLAQALDALVHQEKP